MTMKPKVNLVNHTKDMLELWCYVRRVMHSEVPDSVEELKANPQKWLGMSIEDYINDVLLLDGMPTFSEYGSLTFKLENVSRSLQQQLTRHRVGFSYSIQSLRCVDLPNFATDGKYYNPFEEGTEQYNKYHTKMLKIQEEYKQALADGVPTQDARGLLPMNIYSTITFSCTPRAFFGMINKRMCLKTQGEFREVAQLMANEVYEKIDPRLKKWIGKPCELSNYKYCMMKGENQQQVNEGKLTGKQNTQYACPIYVAKFTK